MSTMSRAADEAYLDFALELRGVIDSLMRCALEGKPLSAASLSTIERLANDLDRTAPMSSGSHAVSRPAFSFLAAQSPEAYETVKEASGKPSAADSLESLKRILSSNPDTAGHKDLSKAARFFSELESAALQKSKVLSRRLVSQTL